MCHSVCVCAVVGRRGTRRPVQVLVFLSLMLLNRDLNRFLIWAGFFPLTTWAKQTLLVYHYRPFIEASKWSRLIVINKTHAFGSLPLTHVCASFPFVLCIRPATFLDSLGFIPSYVFLMCVKVYVADKGVREVQNMLMCYFLWVIIETIGDWIW